MGRPGRPNTSVGHSQEDKIAFYRELSGYADEPRPPVRTWLSRS
jgi:hypothetical protein